MNLFVTNACPVKAAQEHNSVHVVKMILEVAQMLSTAHFVVTGVQRGYKPTHANHPCALWIRETCDNYQWAHQHFTALCEEYTFRTGKTHKSSELIDLLRVPPTGIKPGERTPFAMAMPIEFQRLGLFDQTKAYQAYLNNKFAEWRTREKPMKVEWKNRSQPSWLSA